MLLYLNFLHATGSQRKVARDASNGSARGEAASCRVTRKLGLNFSVACAVPGEMPQQLTHCVVRSASNPLRVEEECVEIGTARNARRDHVGARNCGSRIHQKSAEGLSVPDDAGRA